MLVVCEVLAKANPKAMLERLPQLATQLSDDWPQHRPLEEILMKAMRGQGREATQVWLERLPPAYRRSFFDSYADQWATRDPELVVDYLLTQKTERSQVGAIQQAVSAWARRAPAEAANKVSGFVDDEMRSLGFKNVMSVWKAADPVAAEAWMQEGG